MPLRTSSAGSSFVELYGIQLNVTDMDAALYWLNCDQNDLLECEQVDSKTLSSTQISLLQADIK